MFKFGLVAALIIISAVTSAVYQVTQKPDINYFKGHRLFEESKYSQAIPYFNKALSLQPEKIKALQELGYSYQWTKQYPLAIETFNKILAAQPQNYKIKYSLAQAYSWMNHYPEAIKIYSEIIKDTGDGEAKLSLAEVYLWDKQYAKAEEISARLAKSGFKNIKARIILAKSLQYSGRYGEAMRIYKGILLEKNIKLKDRIEVEELYAEAGMIVKDYGISIGLYMQVLKRDPKNIKARLRLADILSWEGNYEDSITEFQKILKQGPDNIEVKKRMAEVYAWKKDYAKAEELYKEIIKADPLDSQSCAFIGQILIWQGRYSEARHYLGLALTRKKDGLAEGLYGQALLYSADPSAAKKFLRESLNKNPNDLGVKVNLADACAYTKEFKKAIKLYEEVLGIKNTLEVENKLADVLSWDKQYERSIKLYDEILAQKEDFRIRLQKARVLGWAKQYARSLDEYQKILDIRYEEFIDLEMRAKKAYWDSRVKQAISLYNSLIAEDPQNTEAMFDLSQVYSYQSMWQGAIREYDKILSVYPDHFRAKDGREKARLSSKHIMLKTGYEFLEQNSNSRDMDLKRNSYFSCLSFPLEGRLSADIQYRFNRRDFSDFSDVIENEARIKFTYINNPGWWAGAFYNYTAYSEHIRQTHTFGVNENFRVWDRGIFSLAQERERLENNSTVIRNRVYRDNYKERLSLDINKKLKGGIDYLYSLYSDGNFLHQPGLDMLYFFSLDPKRFSLKYRYSYQNFHRKQSDYFTPKGFSTNSLCLNWRHYLNKEEIFFGSDDLYYDLSYEISCDSTNIVGNKFSGELNWDVSKRLSLNVRGSVTNSSANVYNDKNITAGIRYYF